MLAMLALVVFVVAGFLCVSTMLKCYRKCAPNQALIISGANSSIGGSSFRIVIGQSAIVLPVIQQCSYLSLELMTLELESARPMLTRDGEPWSVQAVAQVKVPARVEAVAIAAELFLTKTTDQIKAIASEKLNDNLRSVVGTLDSGDVQLAYRQIGELVQAESGADLERMGLSVVSFNVKNLTPVAINDGSPSQVKVQQGECFNV